MRRLPTILAGTFIAITLARVAALAQGPLGAGFLGWLFAVGLGAGVYTASYWLKVSDVNTQRAALAALGFFVIADLVFNGAEVYRHMLASGAWADWMLRGAGAIYAVFPTLAAGLMGWLQGRVDRLPPAPMRKGAILPRIKLWFAAQLDLATPQAAVQDSQVIEAAAQPAIAAPEAARRLRVYTCACDAEFASQQSYAAHRRHCAAQAADVAAQGAEK
jgi:hypothetical protein